MSYSTEEYELFKRIRGEAEKSRVAFAIVREYLISQHNEGHAGLDFVHLLELGMPERSHTLIVQIFDRANHKDKVMELIVLFLDESEDWYELNRLLDVALTVQTML